MSYWRWLRGRWGARADSGSSVSYGTPPIAVRRTTGSVLATTETFAESRFFVAKRPRLATCGGAAWFHGYHIATVNLLGNAVHTYRFDPHSKALAPLQTLVDLEGLGRPENLAFSPDGDVLAVTNSVGATITIYGVDPETHAIDPTPRATITCSGHINPHGVCFEPRGRALCFSTVEAPGSLRCFRIVRSVDAGIELIPFQELVNRHAPLRPKGVAFSPDGRFLAIAYGSNAMKHAHRDQAGFLAVHTFDMEHGCSPEAIWTSGKELGLRCAEDVNFLPDASHVVITDQANDSAMVIGFDKHTGAIGEKKAEFRNPQAQLSFPHGNGISGDGKCLAIANYGNDTLTIYALDFGQAD